LGLFRLKNGSSLIDLILNYKSLNAMICCEFDLKQLVQKCITFAQNLSNIFTIILHSTEENLKDLYKELPKNIRLVIETVKSEEYD
jgi:hypothetical protein